MEKISASPRKEQVRRMHIRNSIVISITTYVFVIGFLALLNYFATPGYWWVVWPALGWGLGLAISTVSRILTLNTPEYEDGE